MQALALAEGSLARHMQTALFTQSNDNRLLTHRQLSRHLVGLWMVGNEPALRLLSRIMVCAAATSIPAHMLSPPACWNTSSQRTRCRSRRLIS